MVPEALDTVDDTIKKTAPLLGFDSYIKLPVITYDPAGHCLAKDEAIYYKMPSDPSGPFYERLWKVDGVNPEGKEEEPVGGSLKKKLLDRMSSIDGCDATGKYKEGETSSLAYKLNSKMGELSTEVAKWNGLITSANDASKDAVDKVDQVSNRMNNIEKSFDTLKNTDFEQLKADVKSVKEEFNEIKTEDLLDLLRNLNSLSEDVRSLSGRVAELEKK